MCALFFAGKKFDGEVADLFAKGMSDGMLVEMGVQEPKRYQLLWNEKSEQDSCVYKRVYQYDSFEDAKKVQKFLWEQSVFSVVVYKDGVAY